MSTLKEYTEYLNQLSLDKSCHTISSYQIAIDKFISYFKIESLDQLKMINSAQCVEYLTWLKSTGVCNNSINAYMRPLKAFFNFLKTKEYIEKSCWTNIKELRIEKKERAFLSYDEIDAMINSCKNLCEKTMIALFISSGLRRNELVTLKLNDVRNGHITVMGKGNKYRTLALQDEVYELLDNYITTRKTQWGNKYDNVFISTHGKPFTGQAILFKVNSLCRRAKLPEDRIEAIHTHSLRHTFGANLLESGADIKLLQVALGHSTLKVTSEIYSHIRNSALDVAIKNQRKIV